MHTNDSASSDDTSDSSITINPSRSNEERRDLYETKYAREKPFHNSFRHNDKISTQHHGSRSSTSTDDTSRDTANNKKDHNEEDLTNNYLNYCTRKGLVDDEKDLTEEIKRVTKKYGWKTFKILDNDDWRSDSNFAGIIMRKLGILEGDESHVSRARKWDKIKKEVVIAMQAIKSSATQAMKKVFIGT